MHVRDHEFQLFADSLAAGDVQYSQVLYQYNITVSLDKKILPIITDADTTHRIDLQITSAAKYEKQTRS